MLRPEDRGKIVRILIDRFSYEDLRSLYFDLGVDWESLPGESKREKSLELLVYMERHARLIELIELIEMLRPNVNISYIKNRLSLTSEAKPPISGMLEVTTEGDKVEAIGELGGNLQEGVVYNKDIIGLQNELASIRQQILELSEKSEVSVFGDEQLKDLLNEILKGTNRAVGRTEDLKADLILPSPELRQIRMIPEHQVERLEEYRSDENIVFLVMGLFAGAAVGIVVNWATNSTFTPTPISITFLLLFALLAAGAYFWSYRLKKRVTNIHQQLPSTSNPKSQ